jgi:hypothetical protein
MRVWNCIAFHGLLLFAMYVISLPLVVCETMCVHHVGHDSTGVGE